jgi:hypothetical protein
MKKKKDIIFELYKDTRTVFRINDVALLLEDEDYTVLRKKMYYYVHIGKLLNPRKGIYGKADYNPEELACLLYPPTYISLEYVLQKAGIVFQYNNAITNVSYLSREVTVDNRLIHYRKIKGEILTNTKGIILNKNHTNIATPERAFLDMLYLSKNFYFDNLNPLNKNDVYKLISIYNSQTLLKTVTKILPR